VELDGFPHAFRRDLLVHEAHRHPYIEQFGLLCLLKVRCRDVFGRRANAAWRLLFILTLMPWLTKYRAGAAGANGPSDPFGVVGGDHSHAEESEHAFGGADDPKSLRALCNELAALCDGDDPDDVARVEERLRELIREKRRQRSAAAISDEDDDDDYDEPAVAAAATAPSLS